MTLWPRVAEPIRASIAAGMLRPGDPLPSVTDLAEVCVYSRSAVARAYAELASERLIERRDDGFFVAGLKAGRR